VARQSGASLVPFSLEAVDFIKAIATHGAAHLPTSGTRVRDLVSVDNPAWQLERPCALGVSPHPTICCARASCIQLAAGIQCIQQVSLSCNGGGGGGGILCCYSNMVHPDKATPVTPQEPRVGLRDVEANCAETYVAESKPTLTMARATDANVNN